MIFYVLLATGALGIFAILSIPWIRRKLASFKLDKHYLEFITLLLIMESSGIRLYEVFKEAVKGNLTLPNGYNELAKKYELFSKISPDPYVCIRKLAENTPSEKVSQFLKAYSEVLISTGDTRSLVESSIKEEFQGLKTRVNDYASLLDNLYESYLIVLLGVLVYAMLPLAKFPPQLLGLLISGISVTSYLIAIKLLSMADYYAGIIVLIPTGFLVAMTPLVVFNHVAIIIHCVLTLILGLILNQLVGYVYVLESKFFTLLEDLYSEARQGIPLDTALIKIGNRYGDPINRISDLLKLGFKPKNILSVVRLPPLSYRILDLILSPILYSRGSPGYLGHVLGVIDSITGLRRILREKSRIYYLYALVLILVILFVSRIFVGNVFAGLNSIDELFIDYIIYVSGFESILIASIIGEGYWFRSLKFYLMLTLLLAIVFLY